jgi:hypothetical protein
MRLNRLQIKVLRYVFWKFPTPYEDNSRDLPMLDPAGKPAGKDPGGEQPASDCYQITNRGIEELCKPGPWTECLWRELFVEDLLLLTQFG